MRLLPISPSRSSKKSTCLNSSSSRSASETNWELAWSFQRTCLSWETRRRSSSAASATKKLKRLRWRLTCLRNSKETNWRLKCKQCCRRKRLNWDTLSSWRWLHCWSASSVTVMSSWSTGSRTRKDSSNATRISSMICWISRLPKRSALLNTSSRR